MFWMVKSNRFFLTGANNLSSCKAGKTLKKIVWCNYVKPEIPYLSLSDNSFKLAYQGKKNTGKLS